MIGTAGYQATVVEWLIAIAAALVACAPGVGRVLDTLRAPSRKLRAIIALTLFVGSARYFLYSAERAGRPLIPIFHDEFMYLLQARMLSVGRLWMPQHELAEFFDSFYVFVKPVYAAPYFPGAALTYVPGTWLHIAPWATAILICGLVVALTYLVVTRLVDGVAGLLAALMLVAMEQMRGIAVMTMSHTAFMLLMLTTVLAWSEWRRAFSLRWAAAFGASAGWLLITRPLDGLCFLLPVAAGAAWDAWRSRAQIPSWRRVIGKSVSLAVVAALPFVALQLTLDRGITGRWLKSPIGEYGRLNFPGLDFGFHHRDPNAVSPSELPQARDYFVQFFRDDLARHQPRGFWRTWLIDRLEPMVEVALPTRLSSTVTPGTPRPMLLPFALLIPLGLWRLRATDARHLSLVALPVLLSLTYAFYPSYLRHYGVTASIGVILLIVLGLDTIRAGRHGAVLANAVAAALATLCIASFPEISGRTDHFPSAPYLVDINAKLASLDHVPAVVLFRYEQNRTDVNEEPAYNLDAAWPDDAPIIRAQDRGPDNARIFRYYATHGPARFFYRYDRTTGILTELGWATDLASQPPTNPP